MKKQKATQMSGLFRMHYKCATITRLKLIQTRYHHVNLMIPQLAVAGTFGSTALFVVAIVHGFLSQQLHHDGAQQLAPHQRS